MDSEFICLNCDFTGTGTYCSNCGHELTIQPQFIHNLISKKLEKVGFLNFNSASNLNAINIFSSDAIKELLRKSQYLLVSDELTGSDRSIQLVFLIQVENNPLQDLFLSSQSLFSEIIRQKKDLKRHKVINISIITIFTYEILPPPGQLEAIKRNSKTKVYPFFSINLLSAAIVLSNRKLFANRFFLYYREIDSALRQISLPSNSASSHSSSLRESFTKCFGLIVEPFKDYITGVSRIGKLSLLVRLIESDKISISKIWGLVKYILGSIFSATIVAAFLGNDIGLLDIPIIDETINIAMFLAGGFINAAICHFPLRFAGGSGKFKHNMTAATYISITFYPIFTLMEGIYFHLSNGESMPLSAYGGATTIYYYTLLSGIYKISYRKTYIVLSLWSFALILLVIAVIAMVTA